MVFRAKSVLKNGTFLGLFLRISPAAERKWRVRKGTPYRILGSEMTAERKRKKKVFCE